MLLLHNLVQAYLVLLHYIELSNAPKIFHRIRHKLRARRSEFAAAQIQARDKLALQTGVEV